MNDKQANDLMDAVAGAIEAQTKVAYDKLVARILKGEAPQTVIQEIQSQWSGEFQAELRQSFSDLLGRSIGSTEIAKMPIGGIELSQHLYSHSQAVSQVVKKIVEDHAKGMAEASKLAMDIYEGYGFKGKGGDPLAVKKLLPKYLNEALQSPTFEKGLSKILNDGQAASIKTPALKAAYFQAVEALKAGPGSEILKKAMKVAWYERNRYFANRIAQTELARAHSDKKAAEIMADVEIEVVQIRMSQTHPKKDICDLHARVNMWGLGPGCYPKEKAPKPPFHPHCRCKAAPRIDLSADGAMEIPGAHKKYITNLDKGTGAEIMGSKAKRQALVHGGQTVEEIVNQGVPAPYRMSTLGDALPQEAWQIKSLALAKAEEALKQAQEEAAAAALAAQLKAEQEAAAKAAAEAAAKLAQDQAEAQAWIDQVAAGKFGIVAKDGLAKVAPMADTIAMKAAVEDAWAAEKAANAKQALALAYKKAVLGGKTPTKKQQEAFDSLEPAKKAAIQAQIDKAVKAVQEAAKAIEPVPKAQADKLDAQELKQVQSAKVVAAADKSSEIDATGWKKYANQTGGTNPGAFYKDEAGNEWYVKFPKGGLDASRNEVLASKLYALAGVDAIDMHMVKMDGKLGIASRVVQKSTDWAKTQALDAGAWRGFGTDAWLANWDVAGDGRDNTVLVGGKAFRIDVGGSLIFRAQGGLKGKAFGETVGEIKTFRDGTNAQTRELFSKMEEPHVKASVATVLAINPQAIRETVLLHGPGTLAERKALGDLLVARQENLSKQFPTIKAEVAKAIQVAKDAVLSEVKVALLNMDGPAGSMTKAIKSVASRFAKGTPIEPNALTNVAEARAAYNELVIKWGPKLDKMTLDALAAHYEPWLQALETAVVPGLGAKISSWAPPGAKFEAFPSAPAVNLAKIVPVFEPWMFGLKGAIFSAAEAKKIVDAIRQNYAHPKFAGWDDVWGKVPVDHVNAAALWTSGEYLGVYKAVINGTVSKRHSDWMDLIDQAISLAQRYEGKSARGIAPPDYQKTLAEFQNAFNNGGKVRNDVPSSSKKGEKPFWHGDNPHTDIVLHYDESTRGAYANNISHHHGPAENEVLHPRGEYFVTKAKKDAGGVWHFWLKDAD